MLVGIDQEDVRAGGEAAEQGGLPVEGSFGLFWATLAPKGAKKGPFSTLWSQFWAIWPSFRWLVPDLRVQRPFRPVLGLFGLLSPDLGCRGGFWASLGSLGPSGPSRGHIWGGLRPFGPVLGPFGLFLGSLPPLSKISKEPF
jgi:hypothetical protein